MKLSKQERIGAMIILAIVILALGAFLLIKPEIEAIGTTRETLAQKQTELNAAKEKQSKKDPLRDEIMATYQEGEHLADMFFPELASYEADDAFRAFILQCKSNIVVEEVEVREPSVETLSTTFYVTPDVEYSLKTYATQGVEPTDEELRLAARKVALQSALGDPQTIGASKVTFTVSALSNYDLIKFCDEINDYVITENGSSSRKAIMIGGMALEYKDVADFYDELSKDSEDEMNKAGTDALSQLSGINLSTNDIDVGQPDYGYEPENPNNGKVAVEDYLFQYTDTLTFFSIERMQNPTAQLDAQDGI